ncbi:MAG: glycerol-3-phosphate 1-O-acyltransferase [Acidimicrobiia bacterium]|nr:glycerol-3-phosphate 1-O-acyltransferase [Acidimicrobiia bacterium]
MIDTAQRVTAEIEPSWPVADATGIVFLVEAETPVERRLLRDWITHNRPLDRDPDTITTIDIPTDRAEGRTAVSTALETRLAAGDDPVLAPLRVAWLPAERNGERSARLADLLTFRNPRDPGSLWQRWLTLKGDSDRWRVIAAEPARASELMQRWREKVGANAGHLAGFPQFVARQATLALERAERQVIGGRYKVPRLVREEITERLAFRTGIARLATELGRAGPDVLAEAEADLREIAAGHSPYLIDVSADLGRLVFSKAYDREIEYDRDKLVRIGRLGQQHPLVFLPSHRTYIDTLVLRQVMHECGLPPNHVASGINLSFFPLGPVLRQGGMFFIRRSFKDDEVYKFVLREYIAYLLEKRFSLEWYIEGGRSRSGKLLPARYGLLSYVAEAWREGRVEDVLLVPVSISYDQIQDVSAYTAEAHGAAKKPESVEFAVKYLRDLRERFGAISMGFGDPVSLRDALGPPELLAVSEDGPTLDLQKVAFQVMVGINDATPITPTSLVTLALLATGGRAMSVPEILVALDDFLNYISRHDLPATAEGIDTPRGVVATLDALMHHDVVECFSEGAEAVYRIGPDQHLTAAYYRNTIIHFFVRGAIAELALLATAEHVDEVKDPLAELWDAATALRDLLKFEFYFTRREQFVDLLAREIGMHCPDWEEVVAGGDPSRIRAVVREFRPLMSPTVLRSFLEAYLLVADELASAAPGRSIDESELLASCLSLGTQYLLQRRIRNTESNSRVLFENALRLARNRDLLDPGAPDLVERRRLLAEEIRAWLRRIDGVDAIVATRLAGLLD